MQESGTAMAGTPQISVVLCSYNGARFLPKQLASIAEQTLPPFEVIACDDGSNDATIAILESFKAAVSFPIHIHRNEKRLGSTRNFEHAMRLARGNLIALCDQDDQWKPEKLERLAQILNDEAIAGVFTDADLIDDASSPMEGTLWSRGHLPPRAQQLFRQDPVGLLLKQDVATGATMLVRPQVLNLFQTIPEEWVHDGWLTWMIVLHAAQIGRLELSPETLTQYRVHSQQQTGEAATRIGLRSEPLAQRLAKARSSGHMHHKATATRLNAVLQAWLSTDGKPDDAAARRLRGAITLNEKRSSLPASTAARAVHILLLLPSYLRYGRGLASAGRDLWA
jgi:hypothetical protein